MGQDTTKVIVDDQQVIWLSIFAKISDLGW